MHDQPRPLTQRPVRGAWRAQLLSVLAVIAWGSFAAAAFAAPKHPIAELGRLAQGGDADAQVSLGIHYRDGDGVAQDHAKALDWFRSAADQGSAEGMDNVGFMYLRGWGVPEDFNIAAAFFKAASAKGLSQGQFNLGRCYFSGQGVEQDYAQAIACWRRAAKAGHRNSIWRLAMLHAAGEGLPRDWEKAMALCRSIADKGHSEAMVLLGELHSRRGEQKEAARWWGRASEHGSAGADALLRLSEWRQQAPVAGEFAYVEVDHLYQGWNNCGATSLAMFLRHDGIETTPYAIKRLCPRSPIGTGTDWADLIAAVGELGAPSKLVTFPNDDAGFAKGVEFVRAQLDARRPPVIDFTVIVDRGGVVKRFGHTLLVVGYHAERDLFVLKNPNQPSPGIELMSAEQLKKSWYSAGYSRLAKGRAARPLIVREES